MIIYGTKGSLLKSEKVRNIKCNHCGEPRTHTISIYGRYFYLYWIPFFPIGKKGISECDHCKVSYDSKQMDGKLKHAHDTIKSDTKTPIKHWIGLLIIGLFFILPMFLGPFFLKDYEEKKANYITNPQMNDIIDYKSSENTYSTLKITKVTNNSVFVVANTMEIGKKRKLYKIDKEENYNAERYGMSVTEYKDSFTSKRFLDVERD